MNAAVNKLSAAVADTVNLHASAAGRFKIEAFRADANGDEIEGSRRVAAPWFDNLIVNVGLDKLATANANPQNIISECRVGSGSTAPAFTDTALVSQVAVSTTVVAGSLVSGVQSTTPYFGWFRKTFRFAAGVATGNLSEVAMARAGDGLFSRALIVDSGGAPTTITVLADESLDVTYELRLYPPLTDVPWSATISGVAYSGVVRADSAGNSAAYNAGGPNWNMGGPAGTGKGAILLFSTGIQVYNGSIGAVTGAPTGTVVNVDTTVASAVTAGSYTAGSFTQTYALLFDLTVGNVAGGISALRVVTTLGRYQLSVSPPLPKDATKRLTLNVSMTWGRFTP